MFEREEKRAIHLMVLFCYTILTVALIGESLLLQWDKGVILLLLLGLAFSWWFHITEKIPASSRIWIYFTLMMLSFFFYGIHETSVYDLAPMMIVIIILFYATEITVIINLCMVTYYLTMIYDFIFVLGDSMETTSLAISRVILHFALVFIAGHLVKIVMKNRKKAKDFTENRIAGLEETNRRTEDFLANVSHELRTPINAVTGITAVMLKNERDAEKKKDLFSIQIAGHRLFHQIGAILDYTEIDTGRIQVSEEAYMITSVVHDIIAGNRLSERENELELIFDIDAGIPSVLLGDEKKIKKILEHLIDNAYKFTRQGGIYVRVYALHKAYGINLCIQVSDTGVGIPEEELGKIRERFYQSSGGRNRRAGGLGLGLPIVYGMVSAMEGFVQIDSTVGEGTTVVISIPQKISEEASSMALENRKELCLACYLRPEKYQVPEVREYYNEMISHMVQGLDMPLHRVSDIEELEKLTSMYHLSHLFIGREEYEQNQAFMEALALDVTVIVVADDDFALPERSRLKYMRKPFYSLSVFNILNERTGQEDALLKEKHMICPGVRVLVVDDEPMNLMVAEGIFRDYQMDVTTAESGREAIDLCEKETFDLVFLDHMMPEMDGVETIKRLRKIDTQKGNGLTVIAFTANAVSGAREMFLREGFDEFISKPIETMELQRILRKVLPKAFISFVDEKDRTGKPAEQSAGRLATQDKETQNVHSDIQTDALAAEKSTTTDIISSLESIGIRTRSGLQYCSGDLEFYIELLTRFATDAAKKEAEIEEYFRLEDLDGYGIKVHALKSTAKMVGADGLSEKAKDAEMAAKNHDTAYVMEHHAELMAQYHQMSQSLRELLEPEKEEALVEETSIQTEPEGDILEFEPESGIPENEPEGDILEFDPEPETGDREERGGEEE